MNSAERENLEKLEETNDRQKLALKGDKIPDEANTGHHGMSSEANHSRKSKDVAETNQILNGDDEDVRIGHHGVQDETTI